MDQSDKNLDFYKRVSSGEDVNALCQAVIKHYYNGDITRVVGRRVNKAFKMAGKSVDGLCQLIDRHIGKETRSQLAAKLPVQKNKIFVMTFQKKLQCNPRYIVQELLRRNDDLDIVFCGNEEPITGFEGAEKIRVVKRGSFEQILEQATAAVWIDNAINCTWFPMMKKPGQYYIDTWHGSLGLKRIDKDTQKPRWLWSADIAVDQIDCMLSNSTFETDVYRQAYWPDTKVFEVGHARNDILFDQQELSKLRAEVYQHYRIDPACHLALYAPTFRDKEAEDFDVEDLKFDQLKAALEKKYGGKWYILVRAHSRGKLDVKRICSEYECVINAGDYPDMQELMCGCDLGITDYSSWICDYLFLRRPGLLYVPDLEHYAQDDRGFYYPLTETPFPICQSFDALLKAIEDFDINYYNTRVDAFLNARGCVDDGHASERIADFIEMLVSSDEVVDISKISSI